MTPIDLFLHLCAVAAGLVVVGAALMTVVIVWTFIAGLVKRNS